MQRLHDLVEALSNKDDDDDDVETYNHLKSDTLQGNCIAALKRYLRLNEDQHGKLKALFSHLAMNRWQRFQTAMQSCAKVIKDGKGSLPRLKQILELLDDSKPTSGWNFAKTEYVVKLVTQPEYEKAMSPAAQKMLQHMLFGAFCKALSEASSDGAGDVAAFLQTVMGISDPTEHTLRALGSQEMDDLISTLGDKAMGTGLEACLKPESIECLITNLIHHANLLAQELNKITTNEKLPVLKQIARGIFKTPAEEVPAMPSNQANLSASKGGKGGKGGRAGKGGKAVVVSPGLEQPDDNTRAKNPRDCDFEDIDADTRSPKRVQTADQIEREKQQQAKLEKERQQRKRKQQQEANRKEICRLIPDPKRQELCTFIPDRKGNGSKGKGRGKGKGKGKGAIVVAPH